MVVLTWSNEGLSQQVWDSLRVEQSGAGAGAVDCLGSRCRCGGAVRAQNAVGLSPFTERRGALGGGGRVPGVGTSLQGDRGNARCVGKVGPVGSASSSWMIVTRRSVSGGWARGRLPPRMTTCESGESGGEARGGCIERAEAGVGTSS